MQKSNAIKAIIGLGNPGEQYELTYHNVGKMAVEYMASQQGRVLKTPSHKSFSATSSSPILAYAETFMNGSGRAVKELSEYFSLTPDQIVVAHDDSDMTIGTWKLASEQSDAGHHGIESVINHLGTNKFQRIKIGIRPSQENVRKKAEEFVLKRISKKDRGALEDVFEEIRQKVAKL